MDLQAFDEEGRNSRMFSQALLCDNERELLAAGAPLYCDGAWGRSYSFCGRLAVQHKSGRGRIHSNGSDQIGRQIENFRRQRSERASSLAVRNFAEFKLAVGLQSAGSCVRIT